MTVHPRFCRVEADGNVRASVGKLEITGIRGSSTCCGAWFVRWLHPCTAPQIVGRPKAFEGGQSGLGKAERVACGFAPPHVGGPACFQSSPTRRRADRSSSRRFMMRPATGCSTEQWRRNSGTHSSGAIDRREFAPADYDVLPGCSIRQSEPGFGSALEHPGVVDVADRHRYAVHVHQRHLSLNDAGSPFVDLGMAVGE